MLSIEWRSASTSYEQVYHLPCAPCLRNGLVMLLNVSLMKLSLRCPSSWPLRVLQCSFRFEPLHESRRTPRSEFWGKLTRWHDLANAVGPCRWIGVMWPRKAANIESSSCRSYPTSPVPDLETTRLTAPITELGNFSPHHLINLNITNRNFTHRVGVSSLRREQKKPRQKNDS